MSPQTTQQNTGLLTPNALTQNTNLLSSLNAPDTQQPNPNPQPNPQPQQNESWWKKLLPTAGALLPTIIDVAGAALAPETGGLSLIPGTVLAAAGATGGKALENKLTGQKVTNDLAGAAISGALGQLGGEATGKIISKVAGTGTNLAEEGASKLLAGQAPKGTIDADLAHSLLKEHGITNLKQAGQLANVYTGSGEAGTGQALLNKAVEDAVAKNGPSVDLTDLSSTAKVGKNATIGAMEARNQGNMLEDFIAKNGLTPTQANAVRTNIDSISKGLEADIGGNVNSTDALNFQRKVAKLADDQYKKYVRSGYQDPVSSNLYNTYKQVELEAKDRLFAPGGKDIPINSGDKKALIDAIQQHAGPINQQSANTTIDAIKNAKTLSDLRSIQSPWVNVNNALKQGELQASKNFGAGTPRDLVSSMGLPLEGAGVGSLMGGTRGGIVGGLVGLAAKSPIANTAGTAALKKTSDILGNDAFKTILPALTRASTVAGTTGMANLVSDQAKQAPTNNLVNNGVSSMTPQNNLGMPAENPVANTYNMMAGDTALAPMQYGSVFGPQITTLAPELQKQEMVKSLLSALLPTYAQAGGPGGFAGGLEQELTGLLPGTAANTYHSQSAAAAAALAKQLGISPQEAAAMLPQLTQTPTTAAPQVGGIQSVLGSLGL